MRRRSWKKSSPRSGPRWKEDRWQSWVASNPKSVVAFAELEVLKSEGPGIAHLGKKEREGYNALTTPEQVIERVIPVFVADEGIQLGLDDFLQALTFLFAIKKLAKKPLFYNPRGASDFPCSLCH